MKRDFQDDQAVIIFRKIKKVFVVVVLAAVVAGIISIPILIFLNDDAPSYADVHVQFFLQQIRPPMPEADQLGFSITIPDEINRIVVIGAYVADIISRINLDDLVVAADLSSVEYLDSSHEIYVFDIRRINLDAITALQPDVVLAVDSVITELDLFSFLNNSDLQIVYITQSIHFGDTLSDIRFISNILDAWTAGNVYIEGLESQFGILAMEIMIMQSIALREQDWFQLAMPDLDIWGIFLNSMGSIATMRWEEIEPRPRVFFEVNTLDGLYTFGDNTLINTAILFSGGENIFEDRFGLYNVTEHEIFLANPDIIITNNLGHPDPIGEIKSRAGWESLSAVQNERVYFVDIMNANCTIRNRFGKMVEIHSIINAELINPEA